MLTTSEVALIVAAIALLGSAATIIQKRFADRRDAWWGRTQWALERIVAAQGNDDKQSTIGLVMLASLQASRLATNEERDMLDEVADAMLPSAPGDQP
jgi:uncharacterized membrane protein YhaH (DUF805 family)